MGGSLELRLKNLPSDVTGQGTSVNLMDRNPRGRPKLIVEKHLHVAPIEHQPDNKLTSAVFNSLEEENKTV